MYGRASTLTTLPPIAQGYFSINFYVYDLYIYIFLKMFYYEFIKIYIMTTPAPPKTWGVPDPRPAMVAGEDSCLLLQIISPGVDNNQLPARFSHEEVSTALVPIGSTPPPNCPRLLLYKFLCI
jgi:hypothetical protein